MSVQTGQWSSGVWDCFNDIPICLGVYCFAPRCVSMNAEAVDSVQVHGWGNLCCVFCSQNICGLLCCPRNVGPCWFSSFLDKAMAKKGITTYPEPCGNSSVCDGDCKCYWQMCLPCTSSCTLCLILRELKK